MIEDNWKELALKEAHEYVDLTGVALTTLGARIVGDADFFPDLENSDRGCNCKTLLKIKNWFKENKPKRSKK